MKTLLLTLSFIVILFTSCSFDQSVNINSVVDNYYAIYNGRQDFEKFIEFYDENIVLEDIINGDRIIGKKALKSFFDWDNPSFENFNSDNLIVQQQIIDKNKVVIKGYFTSFKWADSEIEAMHFTSFLTFNDSGKIINQVDWINYPATLINYDERKNSNNWIK